MLFSGVVAVGMAATSSIATLVIAQFAMGLSALIGLTALVSFFIMSRRRAADLSAPLAMTSNTETAKI